MKPASQVKNQIARKNQQTLPGKQEVDRDFYAKRAYYPNRPTVNLRNLWMISFISDLLSLQESLEQ